MAKGTLRAVGEDEKPEPVKPETIEAAIDMGERTLLVALREKVAAEIDTGVPAHTLAGLMKHLRELDKEIRAIDARQREGEGEPTSGNRAAGSQAFDPASAI